MTARTLAADLADALESSHEPDPIVERMRELVARLNPDERRALRRALDDAEPRG